MGNKESRREINGVDLVNLALYRLVRPAAYLSEVKAYIYNRNPTNLPYSDSQIYRAEQKIGLSRKASSTTSECAYLPINLQKREDFGAYRTHEGLLKKKLVILLILMNAVLN